MLSAGIKDLKNNLSRYLSRVKNGEQLRITERGRPIARIVPEDSPKASTAELLRPLINKGLVTLPSRTLDRNVSDPVEVSGKPASEMAIEDRR
jgi:prevent-host-death family protein